MKKTTKNHFDAVLGESFLETVPRAPGVYEWLGANGETLYVGKAKDLHARLSQYRTATRKKATRKRWDIVRASSSLRFRVTESELAALLLENELIQSLRPPLNVAGAFEFLYPCIGLRRVEHQLDLVCTTAPEAFEGFVFTGAFRSPALTRTAFASLVELLSMLGHLEPSRRVTDVPKVPFSRVVRLRRLPSTLDDALWRFLWGEGRARLRPVVVALLDRPEARRHSDETQAHLLMLQRFSEAECEPLAAVQAFHGAARQFLPQRERDRAFIAAKQANG